MTFYVLKIVFWKIKFWNVSLCRKFYIASFYFHYKKVVFITVYEKKPRFFQKNPVPWFFFINSKTYKILFSKKRFLRHRYNWRGTVPFVNTVMNPTFAPRLLNIPVLISEIYKIYNRTNFTIWEAEALYTYMLRNILLQFLNFKKILENWLSYAIVRKTSKISVTFSQFDLKVSWISSNFLLFLWVGHFLNLIEFDKNNYYKSHTYYPKSVDLYICHFCISRDYPFFCKKGSQVYFFTLY